MKKKLRSLTTEQLAAAKGGAVTHIKLLGYHHKALALALNIDRERIANTLGQIPE